MVQSIAGLYCKCDFWFTEFEQWLSVTRVGDERKGDGRDSLFTRRLIRLDAETAGCNPDLLNSRAEALSCSKPITFLTF